MTSPTPTSLYGYRLREEQRRILAYESGKMGVSAVPGSGKTLTLSLLAARLIIEGKIGDRGEVLVVTVQNSAVVNIAHRIREILAKEDMPPVGFHVCTLHKLAADIMRRRYDLAGVDEAFVIVDESESRRLMSRAFRTWLATRQAFWHSFLPGGDGGGSSPWMQDAWRKETERIGREVSKICKHLRLTPAQAQQLASREANDSFLRIGIELYALYTEYLKARGGLDFDDLIWRAIEALQQDPSFLENLREQWPYILEDEAQDSSPLQEHILNAMGGQQGNLVRVGDPNQSINSTFTAADPHYFRRFLNRSDVTRLTLPQSGRCGAPIMDLANHLVRWALADHPEPLIRQMAFEPQEIRPTQAGDAQPNPKKESCGISFANHPFEDQDQEATSIVNLCARFLRQNTQATCAVLCPTQYTGTHVVHVLEELDPPVPFDDLLVSTPRARSVAGLLATVFAYLDNRTSAKSLCDLFGELTTNGHLGTLPETEPGQRSPTARAEIAIRSLWTERLLFPTDVVTLREALPPSLGVSDGEIALIQTLRRLVARWVRASAQPPDQLLLTIAQDLYQDEAALAVCHVLANSYRSLQSMHPDWRLREYQRELLDVARNRHSLGLSLTDSGYVAQPGTIVVTTMHKAKGLEWDMVCLMGVDSLEFPATRDDAFRDGVAFMQGRAPAVEARKRLEQLAGADFACPDAVPLVDESRREYIAEHLRLLYVGITRARRYLCLSFSKQRGRRTVQPAVAYTMLRQYYRSRRRSVT